MKWFRVFSSLLLCLPSLTFAYVDEVNPPLERFSAYKQSFFVGGHPDEKLQLSLKGQILKNAPFYFGYTQLMMWDLFKVSNPIRDTNYNPELFYRFKKDDGLTWLDLEFEHESNGRKDEDSRSWNRIAARYTTSVSNFHWSFKIWYPFYFDTTNFDLPRYRGIYEFEFTVSDLFNQIFQKGDVTLRFYSGGKYYVNPFQGGQELTFRAKNKLDLFLPLLVIEVFHGYGENQLNFRDERWGFRGGFGF